MAIAAPPSEGEANAELCRYLSKILEVKKNDVVLEKVHYPSVLCVIQLGFLSLPLHVNGERIHFGIP